MPGESEICLGSVREFVVFQRKEMCMDCLNCPGPGVFLQCPSLKLNVLTFYNVLFLAAWWIILVPSNPPGGMFGQTLDKIVL